MGVRLTLIAHASTDALRAAAFPLDEPLDAHGERAAHALRVRARPADRTAQRVFTSPARRAVATAAALGLDAEPVAALRDADAGRWAGRRVADVAAAEPDAFAAWLGDVRANPHGGESLAAVLERTASWLDAQQDAGARQRSLLAVTHAAVIRAAVVHALDASPAAFWRIDVAPLASVVLHGDGRGWRLRRLGDGLDGPDDGSP